MNSISSTSFRISLTALLVAVACGVSSRALSQGIISYSNIEQDNPLTFLINDPCQPSGSRTLVTGPSYSAQIWFSRGDTGIEQKLEPVPSMTGTFNQEGELWFRPTSVNIAGVFGGELITVQIRAWDNRSGLILTWEEALRDPTVAIGSTPLIRNTIILGGRTPDGGTVLGNANVLRYRPAFTMSAICPEPSTYALGGLAASLCWLLRGRRHRSS